MPLKPLVCRHQSPPLDRADGEEKAVEGVFGIGQRRSHRDGVIKRHRDKCNVEAFKERRNLMYWHRQMQFALIKLDRNFPNAHHANIMPPWIIYNFA